MGEQIRHLLRGGGEDIHGHARILVGVGAGEHLRVQPRQHTRQHAGRQALEVAHAHAGDHFSDTPAHVVGAVIS